MMGPFDYTDFLKQFTGIYYSHHVGLRKPEPAFFERVITESNLIPAETLFVDDTEENIVAAEKLGFKTWHFNPKTDNILNLNAILRKVNAD